MRRIGESRYHNAELPIDGVDGERRDALDGA
jgi:hypothetical protein